MSKINAVLRELTAGMSQDFLDRLREASINDLKDKGYESPTEAEIATMSVFVMRAVTTETKRLHAVMDDKLEGMMPDIIAKLNEDLPYDLVKKEENDAK